MNRQAEYVKYVPRRKLRAVGTYYSVYEATQVGLDRPVELRVLNCKVQPDSPQFMRFTHEFRTLAALDHPHVARVLDLGVVSDHVFYVTDLRNAKSLRELLDHHRTFTVDEVLRLARCLAGALEHLHARKIIHRNLTTASIFIDLDTDNPYIAEFSLVKNFNLQSLTHRGIPQMTELMRTPEFQLGRELDERTDIFQLGCVLFQLLTGEEPRMPQVTDPPDEDPELAPRFLNPEVSEEFSQLVARCLHPLAEKRVPTATDLIKELRKVEDKASMKSMLSEIHESTTSFTVSRLLVRQQDSLSKKGLQARKEQEREEKRRLATAAAAEETLKMDSPLGPPARGKRKTPDAPAPGIVGLLEQHKSLVLMISVPAIVLGVLGIAVILRADDDEYSTAQAAARKPRRTMTAPQTSGQKYDEKVRAEADVIRSVPSNKANFHNRWYLLDNWVKQLQSEAKTPPFSQGDLVSIRIHFYRDEKEACAKLDALFDKASETAG